LKIKTYIGFSIKSKQIIYGIDNLLTTKKKINLILVCSLLTENGLNQVLNFANKKSIIVAKVLNTTISELTNKNNCKIIGLTNGSLSKAILNCEQEIKIFNEG